MQNEVLVLNEEKNYPFSESFMYKWIDVAKYLSRINRSANVVGRGIEYNSSYIVKPETGFKYAEVDKDLLAKYLNELKQADTLLGIWEFYMKYAADDEFTIDSGFGLLDKDSEVTNLINFILEYYYRTEIMIDSFIGDGQEFAEVVQAVKFIDQKFLRDTIYNCINIASVEDEYDDKHDVHYRHIIYASETPYLYLNKLFTKEYPSLNKLAVSNFIRNKSYIIFKDKDNNLYNDFIEAFSTLGEVPKIARLHICLNNFPKTDYMLLIKNDCIQIF